jgi:hypothetical protein
MNKEYLSLISAIVLTTATASTQAEIKNFDISGLIETEIAFSNSDTNGDTSDIVVPTVELGIETTFSDQVSASIVLLSEDIGSAEQTDVTVDQAIVNLALGKATVTVGQTYIPFGSFETGVISDPLTLELAETAETVIMYGREMESGLSYSVYAFNGDVELATEDEINDFGFNIAVVQDNWSVGIAYISNIADANTISDGRTGNANTDDVAGLNVVARISAGALSLYFEHVMALDKFRAGDFGGDITTDAEPAATHVEIGYELDDRSAIAVSISSTDEAAEMGVPYENMSAIAYRRALYENASYAVEFLSADEYGNNSDSILTVQLAVEF